MDTYQVHLKSTSLIWSIAKNDLYYFKISFITQNEVSYEVTEPPNEVSK